MRGARAFLHISKMFGERERELRTRRWRGGYLTNSSIDRRVASYTAVDARRRARAHGNSKYCPASTCVDGEALRHVTTQRDGVSETRGLG